MKRIRHIGIVVADLDSTINLFEGFGLTCNEVIEKDDDGFRVALFPIGDIFIEFISFIPGKELDHVLNVVRSQKGSINHVCFEVDNLKASIQAFEKKGAKLVDGCPRPGAHGHIAFFYPETTGGILIELCEL